MIKQIEKAFLLGAAAAPIMANAQKKPNIIYIVTDQQTASAMSCMGNDDLHTPNMDRLAKAGMLFTNAYCTSPLSGPSRGAMFTGCYPHELGIERNNVPLPDSIKPQTLGFMMQKGGYDCIYAGKWHVHTASMPEKEFGFEVIHPHNDNGLAESAVNFLKEEHRKPFFLVIGFDNPHNICEYARDQNLPWGNLEPQPEEELPGLPANFAKNPYDADVIAYEKQKNYSAYPTVNYRPDDWRRYRGTYYRLVEKVDKEIGKVIDELDRQNLWRNSVVIFTSDHGDGVGAHQWNQKSALYEEVTKIPMIVCLPGKKNAGKVMPQLINQGVDFYATLCEWAGTEPGTAAAGVSFKALAEKGDEQSGHQPFVVTETTFDKGTTRGWAVRTAHFKYVLYDKGHYREQLYDMDHDAGEMRNLAIEKKYKKQLEEHRAILDKWMVKHRVRQIRPELHLIPGR